MDEPWQMFYEELLARGENISDQRFGREEDMAEAAHEAYQSASDRFMDQLDMDEDDALNLAKGFMRATRKWIEEGEFDFDDLAVRLEEMQAEWEGQLA